MPILLIDKLRAGKATSKWLKSVGAWKQFKSTKQTHKPLIFHKPKDITLGSGVQYLREGYNYMAYLRVRNNRGWWMEKFSISAWKPSGQALCGPDSDLTVKRPSQMSTGTRGQGCKCRENLLFCPLLFLYTFSQFRWMWMNIYYQITTTTY